MTKLPEKFPFPYEKPYNIQQQFMEQLYSCIDNRKIGIFESPTGTGKTLSIICGAVKWLVDHRTDHLSNRKTIKITAKSLKSSTSKSTKSKSSLPSWVSQQFQQQKISEENNKTQFNLKKLEEYESEIDLLRTTKKRRYFDKLVPERNSDQKPEKPPNRLKIIFASRTHSQLSQFVTELKKSPYKDEVSVVTIASRKALCINEEINKKENPVINEICLEMKNKNGCNDLEDDDKNQEDEENPLKKIKTEVKINKKPKSTKKLKTAGCPYHKLTKELNLRHEIMTKNIQDLEELVRHGKLQSTCPYYTTRRSISNSEIVLVPYNILLNKNLREKSGLDLENNILIIDEAHNLTEAVASIHGVELDFLTLENARNQVDHYIFRYEKRFNEKNLKEIKNLLALLETFLKKSRETFDADKISEMQSLGQFTHNFGLADFHLFEILNWCEVTSIARKLLGSPTEKREEEKPSAIKFMLENKENIDPETDQRPKNQATSRHNLFKILSFFEKIYSENAEDARIIINFQERSFKYLLLNSANVFQEICTTPRSVIIAGGTMKPFDSFLLQMLPDYYDSKNLKNSEKLTIFSCGHVVNAKTQLLPICLSHGPTKQLLDYRFANRENPKIISETYSIINNLSRLIPKGLVIFFPSYKLLEKYVKSWTCPEKISNKKVLIEPKNNSECEKLLQEYELLCQSQNGAILLSVMGGKLAEGINFNDDLGRGVIVIGQPYPDINSPVLQEKLKFLKMEKSDSNNYASILCWRNINQSIGRAIRHVNDYACIVLLDSRYDKRNCAGNLPNWIGDCVEYEDSFGKILGRIRKFFKGFEATNV